MEDPNNKKDDKIMKSLKELLRTVVISVIIVVVLTVFIIRPVRVDGTSMNPTVHDGDIGFSSIISYTIEGIHQFDVVVFYSSALNETLVKRVIGMPGDTVYAKDGVVYVNGSAIDESFLDQQFVADYETANQGQTFTSDFEPVVVKEGHYFVLGDNRPVSLDSRSGSVGQVAKSDLKSKYVIVIFPFNHIRAVLGN